MEIQPLVLINAVGLTAALLPLAPRLEALADAGWACSLAGSDARPSPARPRRAC